MNTFFQKILLFLFCISIISSQSFEPSYLKIDNQEIATGVNYNIAAVWTQQNLQISDNVHVFAYYKVSGSNRQPTVEFYNFNQNTGPYKTSGPFIVDSTNTLSQPHSIDISKTGVDNRVFVLYNQLLSSKKAIYGRFVYNDGTMPESEVLVASNTSYDYRHARAVYMEGQNKIFVIYYGSTSTTYNVYYTLLDISGDTLTRNSAFTVVGIEPLSSALSQWTPQISSLKNGRVVCVWQQYISGHREGILKLYDIDGVTSLGNSFTKVLGSQTGNNLFRVEASQDDPDKFAVIWSNGSNLSYSHYSINPTTYELVQDCRKNLASGISGQMGLAYLMDEAIITYQKGSPSNIFAIQISASDCNGSNPIDIKQITDNSVNSINYLYTSLSVYHLPALQESSIDISILNSTNGKIIHYQYQLVFECNYKCNTHKCYKTMENCTECADIKRDSSDPTCPCKQSENVFDDGSSPLCQNCLSPCAQCSALNTCITCITQTYRDTSPPCQCLPNNFDDSGTCKPCLSPCKECQTTESTCTECYPGPNRKDHLNGCICFPHHFEKDNQCQECHENCEECETTRENCTSCRGANRDLSSCNCTDGFYDNGVDDNCQPCVYPCKHCSSENICTACHNTGNRISSNCQCEPSYMDLIPALQTIGTCTQCTYPCQECETSTTNCTECPPGPNRKDASNGCICHPHHFEKDNQCQECHQNCEECETSSQNCLSCKGTNRDMPSCNCKDTFYYNGTDPDCQPCVYPCLNCSSETTCITCFNDLNRQSNCQCLHGYYDNLSDKECQSIKNSYNLYSVFQNSENSPNP